MQVGQADLVAVDRLVALGIIPDVFEKQHDLGWQRLRVSQFAEVFVADEQPEDVRFAALGDESGVGVGLEADGHFPGGGAHLARQPALRGRDDWLRESSEPGEGHAAGGAVSAAFPWTGRTVPVFRPATRRRRPAPTQE